MTRRGAAATRRRARQRRLPATPSPGVRTTELVERHVPQAGLSPTRTQVDWVEHRVPQARSREPDPTPAERVASIAESIRRAREATPPAPTVVPDPVVVPLPGPPDPQLAEPESRSRRRRWSVVAAVALVAAAVGTWVLGVWEGSDPPSSRAAVAPTPSAAPASTRTASLTTRIRVQPDGTLRVHQRIRSPEPLTSIVVAAPVDPYLTLGTATASDLRVTAGGVRVRGAERVRLASASFAFDESRSVRLSYVLSGALQRADGSTRALARVTSLDLFTGRDLEPATYVVSGAHILNLACSSAGSDDPPEACGSQQGKAWVVRLAQRGSDTSRVMAQLDLVS